MKILHNLLAICLVCILAACNNQPNNMEKTVAEEIDTLFGNHFDYFFAFDSTEMPIITANIEGDKVMLTFNRAEIVKTGFAIDEEYRLPDWPVEVEGLRGTPKSVFIGDIGQDYNPILCVLLDDGHMNILSLWDAVCYGNRCVGQLAFCDIVSMHSGGGGPWEEDGEIFYSYTTIYATDNEGSDHEVMLYPFINDLEFLDETSKGTAIYMLNLSADWKISYVAGWYQSEIDQQFWGDFYEISGDFDTRTFVYGYHITKQMNYKNIEEPNETDIDMEGSFRLHTNDKGEFMITPLTGKLFGPNTINCQLEFVCSSGYGG